MKVKDLIKSLSQYNQELDIIFCDSSYGSIDYEDCEIDRDLVIGKDVTMCYGFYDRNIDGVIPLERTINANNIKGYHYVQHR